MNWGIYHAYSATNKNEVLPEKYTTAYRSVVVFGSVRIIEGELEKRAAARKLAVKYAPEQTNEQHDEMIDRTWERFCMLEMSIAHMTGKVGSALVAKK